MVDMETSRVAKAIAKQLRLSGVDAIFGIPGGGNNLDVIEAARAIGIRFFLAHTETAAAIMAAVYGDITGQPGVCIVTRGPGAASAVNGAAQALLDRQALVVLSDTVRSEDRARISHQRLSQETLYSAVVKSSGTLSSCGPDAQMQKALKVAMSHPRGPVHLDVDADSKDASLPEAPNWTTGSGPSWEECVGVLSRSRKTALILGMGSRAVVDEVRALVQGTNIPVLTTYRAKGVIAESSPNNAGLFTGATIEAQTLSQADLVLTIGLDAVELIPGPWEYSSAVVSLREWPSDCRYFSEELEIVGDLRTDLPKIEGLLGDDWASDFARGRRIDGQRRLRVPGGSRGLCSPQDVVDLARSVSSPSTIATVDSGAHMLVAMALWDTDEPNAVLISSGLATMGFSLPAAIAAAVAYPQRRVVCFIGDGGLGMVMGELESLARLDLDVTVIVFNDSRLSLIGVKAENMGSARVHETVDYVRSDFALVAEGLGVKAWRVDSAERLPSAMEAALLSSGPKLLDVRVDSSVYPEVLSVIRG